jgi:hypothetical protein
MKRHFDRIGHLDHGKNGKRHVVVVLEPLPRMRYSVVPVQKLFTS